MDNSRFTVFDLLDIFYCAIDLKSIFLIQYQIQN